MIVQQKKFKLLALLPLFLMVFIFDSLSQVKSTFNRLEADSLLIVLDQSSGNKKMAALNSLSASLAPLKFDSAYMYAQKALGMAKESRDNAQEALAIFNQGNSYYFKNDLKNALLYYLDAQKIMVKLEPSEDFGNLLLQLGFMHYFTGSKDAAHVYYKKAAKIFSVVDDKKGEMYAYRMLGIINWDFKLCDSALFYDTIWLNYYKLTDNHHEYAKGLSEVGEDLRCMNDTNALSYMKKALQISTQTDNSYGIGLHCYNLGLFYYDSTQLLYNPKRAEAYFLQAIHEIKKTDRYSFAAEFLTEVAGFYLNINELEKTDIYLNEALVAIDSFYTQLPTKTYNEASAKIRFQVNVKKIQVNIYSLFLTLYKLKGNYVLALKHQELKSQAEDSVFAFRVKNQFEFLEAKADNERKEQQIQLLFQKNELQESRIRQSGFLLIGFSVLFIFIILIIFLFIRQSRFKMLQDKILLEQKLLRTQMNPHFIFNSLASVQNFIVKQDDTKASIYLSRFSDLVRSILNNSLEEQITLEEEINTIENYLELQKVRFPEKFDYRLEMDEKIDSENTFIPPMLAQPFIENAIEHGIKHRKSKGNIQIRFTLNPHMIIYEVEDNGVGREKAQEINQKHNSDHKSLATSITMERIRVQNKKQKHKISMTIEDLKNKDGEASGTRVIFLIPF